jgi:hypothetical protein
MPKVRLLTSMAGIDFAHDQGAIIDVTEAEAVRYIAAGIAESAPAASVERASKKVTTEKAVKE